MESEIKSETDVFVSDSFAHTEEVSTVENNELTEEQVIFVTDDPSIIIDEDTTFIDEDGNPIIVNRNLINQNIEPVVIIQEGSKGAEESTSPNDSQQESSAEQNDESSSEQVQFNLDGQEEVQENNPENNSKNINGLSYPTPVLFLKSQQAPECSEKSIASSSITVLDTVHDFEPRVQNITAHVPDDIQLDPLTCRYCLKKFTRASNKLRHLRDVHKIKKHSRNFIKCVECKTSYAHVKQLREHLRKEHKMKMDTLKQSFPNMEAFFKWKTETQRRELSRFTLRQGRRKTLLGQKTMYVCHRAGRYEDRTKGKPRKRMSRAAGTCKLGMMCTATICVEERANEVVAEYCLDHYGHGKQASFMQLTEVEQNAIQESVSNGVSYEDLLDEVCEDLTNDHFQSGLIQGRDIKLIRNAFQMEEYNSGLSDAESVDRWVRSCCQMEDSPILFYRQEDVEDDFLLIIMTEFQKNILLSSDKHILCCDSLFRRKGLRFYLTCLVVLDENDIAFPVAFCISNKVDKDVLRQFYTSVRDSTGPLYCKYFMSDYDSYYYDVWQEVMEEADSKWIWSMWYVDNRFKLQLRPFRGDVAKRAECYRTLRRLLECQSPQIFEAMYKLYMDDLNKDPTKRTLANFVSQQYNSGKEHWAYCFHRDLKFSSLVQFQVLNNSLHFLGKHSRKRRLDKFIFVIMKLLRFKMMERLASIMDDEKASLVVDTINMCHGIGLDIPADRISSLADKIWLIRMEDGDNLYVMREYESCPDHCNLKCPECDVCVHMFSCSCMQSLINANLCQHIHAVVWKFLTPHFSPLPSPAHDTNDDVEDMDVSPPLEQKPFELFDNVLKRTHKLFKKVRSNKCSLNEESLNGIMKRLNECFDICSGKKIQPDPPPPQPPTQTVLVPLKPNVISPQPMVVPRMLAPQMSRYVLLLPKPAK